MTEIIDLEYGAPIDTVCIDCGEPVTVDPLHDDPESARCQFCAYEALPEDIKRYAANQVGYGLIAVARQKAAALKQSNAA